MISFNESNLSRERPFMLCSTGLEKQEFFFLDKMVYAFMGYLINLFLRWLFPFSKLAKSYSYNPPKNWKYGSGDKMAGLFKRNPSIALGRGIGSTIFTSNLFKNCEYITLYYFESKNKFIILIIFKDQTKQVWDPVLLWLLASLKHCATNH